MSHARRFYLVAALALATAGASPALAQEVELKLHTLIPPVANPVRTFLQPWADQVAEASNGRLKVTIYPSMQLGGKPPQLVDQVKDGVVDIVWTLPGYTAGRFPKTEVFELPFVHTTPQATTAALQDFAERHLGDEYADYHVLLLHVHAGSLIMSKDKPVTRFEDMRGLKIRTATRTGAWYLQAVGANPIGAPVPQVAPMLAKGVIDATALPYEIAPAFKLQDLANHFTTMAGRQPRLNTSVFSFLMNKASYADLPADLKQVIDEHSGRGIAEWAGQNWHDIEVAAEKIMRSKPENRFHVVPPMEVAQFRAAAKPAYERWVEEMNEKGFDGASLLAEAKELVEKHTQPQTKN